MKKFLGLLAAVSVLIFASLLPISAAAETVQTCPVSGDQVKSNKFALNYQGKDYRFCCKGCVRKFNKNPSKYIAAENSL